MTKHKVQSTSHPTPVVDVKLFEKEKGGVGSTGTLMSIAHMHLTAGDPVVLVEASTMQSDIANAYEGHCPVERLDLRSDDAPARLLTIISNAQPGSRVLVNVPGGRIEEVEQLHHYLIYAIDEAELPVSASVIWTMGLDAASCDTLLATLGGALPGPLHVNLPAWHGRPHEFTLFGEAAREAVAASGGSVFTMPKLMKKLYDRFRIDEQALHVHARDFDYGDRMALSIWEGAVRRAVGGICR